LDRRSGAPIRWCPGAGGSVRLQIRSEAALPSFAGTTPDDGFLLPRPRSKEALIRQLRDYLHQVCHEVGLSTRIVPHQFRHTYASEMLRAGVGLPALMSLLGHVDPDMTMRYLDVTLTDLKREFQLARSKPTPDAPAQPCSRPAPSRSCRRH